MEKTSSSYAGQRIRAFASPLEGLTNCFVALWCVLMPVTTLLLIPSVQGTIPAYFLAFASVFLVIAGRDGSNPSRQQVRYLIIILLVAGIWLLLLCGSQLGLLVTNRHDFGEMLLNNPGDTRVAFRSVIYTQTLYLVACLCIALFFRFFFRTEWMRYVLWGGWFLAIYGIYEWLFFLVFQQTGDFLGNRTYGEDLHSGSWSQIIQVGPFNLLRIKSTFGEPSFFSAGALPYLFLALEYKRKWLSAALLFCIVFSTSTSAYVGLAFALLIYSICKGKLSLAIILIILVCAGTIATLYVAFPETFDSLFTSKLNAENSSGIERQAATQAMQETASTFTFMNRLFGIGFGNYYGSVFSAVLINTGWIGLIVYSYAFLKPAILLRSGNGGLPLKVGVLALFFLYYLNVAELFLPPTWMFLGLAYWRLDQQRQEKMDRQFGTLRNPLPVGTSLRS
jgi:hypothetical protein